MKRLIHCAALLLASLPLSLHAQTSACHWTLAAPVLDLSQPAQGEPVRLLDPCALRDGGQWHVFAGAMHFTFAELKPGAPTPKPATLPLDEAFVTQVFYFRPTQQWQWIGRKTDTTGRYPENQAVLSTNSRLFDLLSSGRVEEAAAEPRRQIEENKERL